MNLFMLCLQQVEEVGVPGVLFVLLTIKTEMIKFFLRNKCISICFSGNREHAPLLARSGISGLEVTYATDERALFQEVVNIVKR